MVDAGPRPTYEGNMTVPLWEVILSITCVSSSEDLLFANSTILGHFILVFTVCKSIRLWIFNLKDVKKVCSAFHHRILNHLKGIDAEICIIYEDAVACDIFVAFDIVFGIQ